jgi:integrase/recombinase XerD
MSNKHATRIERSNQGAPKGSAPAPVVDSASLAYYLDGFLLDQRAQRHSPATISFYQRYVKHFLWFLDQRGYPTRLADITPSHLRAFLIYLQEETGGRWGKHDTVTSRPLRPAAVHAFARALRAFWNWASPEAGIPNPFARVEMPKLPNAWKVRTYSPAQIEALFRACDAGMGAFMVARDRAILSLLLDSGIRAGELLRLEAGDIDPNQAAFQVQGKGRKLRPVALGTFARRELRAYLAQRAQRPTDLTALWLTRDGAPLAYPGLRDLFDRLKARADIDIEGGVHVCRHTAATMMHRNGMRGHTIQELLGHEHFDTTRRYYLDVTAEDLVHEHEQYGPLDTMSRELRQGRGPATGQGKDAAARLPPAERLAQEVRQSSYRAVARNYGVSDTTIRKRLEQTGTGEAGRNPGQSAATRG